MTSLLRNQHGFTLIEMLVTIVLVGILLPSIFGLLGQVAFHSSRQAIRDQLIMLAEDKLEEVIGRKEANWDWYKDPDQFEETDNPDGNFTRTVTVSDVTNWGSFNLDAWQVTVLVTHPQFPEGYQMSVRLTPYVIQED